MIEELPENFNNEGIEEKERILQHKYGECGGSWNYSYNRKTVWCEECKTSLEMTPNLVMAAFDDNLMRGKIKEVISETQESLRSRLSDNQISVIKHLNGLIEEKDGQVLSENFEKAQEIQSEIIDIAKKEIDIVKSNDGAGSGFYSSLLQEIIEGVGPKNVE